MGKKNNIMEARARKEAGHMILIVLVNDDRPLSQVSGTVNAIRNIKGVKAVLSQKWLQKNFELKKNKA